MFGRILLVGATATLVSACAVLQPFQRSDVSEGYFPAKSVKDQDPYWRRFYELEQQIAQLKASNRQLQASIGQDAANASPEPVAPAPVSNTSMVEDVLTRVRQRADNAIAAIDQAINSLAERTRPATPDVQTVAMAPADGADISGNLQRDGSGDVVGQTTISDARHRYNYSVVYVYPEPRPWNEMWDKLEAAHEKDKWRGFKPGRSSYFIYVGAYYNHADAEQRQQALFSAVGEQPDLRERGQQNALASK